MVTVLTLGFLLVADRTTPSGPKPRVEEVQKDDRGHPYLLIRRTELAPITTTITTKVMVGGKIKVVKHNVVTYQTVEIVKTVLLDGHNVEVFSREGKKLEPAEVRKLLAKSAKVLVSADGKPIDPRHVERMKEGITLVILPSTEKGDVIIEAIESPRDNSPER